MNDATSGAKLRAGRLLALLAVLILAAGEVRAQSQTDDRVAPKGELRVALVTSNPVLVTRNREGEFSGISVELAKELGKKLNLPVRFVPYENTVRYNQSLGKDEWDIAFGPRDLSRTEQLIFSNPFLEVDHSYVARSGASIRTPEEVDRPRVKVAVMQGSGIDGYLSRTLKSAEIVRLFGGLPSAQEALTLGRADVYADFTHLIYRVAAAVPGSTVLVSRFNVVRMTVAMPKSNAAAMASVNDFLASAKRDGLITEAITRAGVQGVRAGR